MDEFHVLVDNLAISKILMETAPPQGKKWSVYLKVDCGKGRGRIIIIHYC